MSARPRTLIFSFWAWLILAPPLITVWGGYSSALDGQERLTGLLAAVSVHLVFGGCFWLAAIVERRLTGSWRWAWFALVLVLLSVLRPLLADLLQAWSGLHIVPPAFWIRFTLNVVGVGVVLLIVYLALEQVERVADTRHRLAAVLDRTEQQRTSTEVRHAALIVEYQRTIADPIRRALAEIDATGPAAKVAAELMRVANRVVRPLTDRAFAMDGGATEYQYRPARVTAPRTVRERLATPQRIEATLPWGPVAVWFALQLPMAMLIFEPLPGLALVFGSTAVVLLCSWLIRLHPMPSSSWLAIALLAIEYAIAGAIGTLVLVAPLPEATTAGYWVYGILLYSVAGTILSIGRSNHLDYLASEQQLVEVLLEAKYRANTAHVQLAETTNLLARRLHASIQADVVAAALQLRIGPVDPGEIVAGLRAQVERVLAAPMLPSSVDVDHDTGRPFPEGIRAATLAGDAAWRESLDLHSEYDEELWEWLADHPERRALVREVGTLGLTSVIRYSRSRRATMTIRVDAGRLRIEIRHPGRMLPKDRRLSGVAAFATRAEVAELVQEGGEIVYRVMA